MNINFKPRFLISDASKATAAAIESCLPNTLLLMCYFHVKYNVRKRLKTFVGEKKYESVMADISALHDCMTFEEYSKLLKKTSKRWRKDHELADFHEYFLKEWVYSRFHKWQIFWTDPGMSHTNSPIESYNKQIKYGFTLCIKHSILRFII